MARMRIYVRQSLRTPAETVFAASGVPLTVPFLRLFTMLRVGLQARQVAQSIIDTGAPLTVFPRKIWRRFASEIEWLSLPAAQATVSWLTNLRGRTGGRSRCRIGRVWVEAFDLERPQRFLPLCGFWRSSRRKNSPMSASLPAFTAAFWRDAV